MIVVGFELIVAVICIVFTGKTEVDDPPASFDGGSDEFFSSIFFNNTMIFDLFLKIREKHSR